MLSAAELIIQAVLDLVVSLLPDITSGSTSAAAKIISLLDKIIPDIIAVVPNLIASVKDMIAAVQSSGPLTADQMTSLETMSATLDAALVQAGKDEGLTDPLAAPAAPAA
jgi:hypothetical protein